MHKLNILIIEDNEFDRAVSAELLGRTSLVGSISISNNCENGLATLAQHPQTDCVLLDLHLPDRLGSDAIDEIRQICPKAAVIMLTGETDQETALDCLKRGADDYLIKGEYTLAILQKTIRYAIERRRAYLHAHDLQLALQHQQQLNEMQQEFICLVAHEFRTPLGIISSATQLLEASPQPPEDLLKRQCQKIITATKRLAGLMDNVLMLRKSEDHKLVGEVTQFEMLQALDDVCERLKEEFPNAQLIVQRDVSQLICSGNPLLYEYAISNLIKNAIKYSADDAAVTIHVGKEKSYATIRIHDHGQGMNNELLSRIGERFMRGEASFSQAGIGLGLYLATQFISRHGGNMFVCSEEGQGTTVMVAWPLVEATTLTLKQTG